MPKLSILNKYDVKVCDSTPGPGNYTPKILRSMSGGYMGKRFVV